MTIHDTPKRSATMPKRGEKKVLPSGICTCPPLPSAANNLSASASLGNGGQVQMPLGKTFFSPRFGAVADRFGVSWMVIVLPKA